MSIPQVGSLCFSDFPIVGPSGHQEALFADSLAPQEDQRPLIWVVGLTEAVEKGPRKPTRGPGRQADPYFAHRAV